MFRRRGFRRPFNRPFNRPLTPDIPPALRRANEFMAMGNYSAAAADFEELARGAVARNGPRAPLLLITAGRMRILAGQIPLGMQHLKQGLGLIASRGKAEQYQKTCQRLADELTQMGRAEEASQIMALMTGSPNGISNPTGIGMPDKKPPILPTNCPGCGGPLRAAEVEWTDEITAECPFCGTPVRVE